MHFFDVAPTPKFMQERGLRGDKFTIRYGVIARHLGKDGSHDLSEKDWEQLPQALQNPFAISKLTDKDNSYRIYTTLQTESGEFVVVGVDVKNAGREIEVNAVSTVFGRRNNANLPINEEVIYRSEEITPEQSSLLERPNFAQYPTEQELSESKDTTNSQTSNELNKKNTQSYTITPVQYTTKRGKVLDMHLVKFAGTLTKEQQRAAKELAKAEKGWYDREQGGFMMRSEESAKQLADTILNNDNAVSDAQQDQPSEGRVPQAMDNPQPATGAVGGTAPNQQQPSAKTGTTTPEQARQLHDRVAQWESTLQVPIHIVNTPDEITNHQARTQILAGNKLYGWYDDTDSTVYLYAPACIDDINETDKTILHEVVAHKGVRALFKDEAALNRLYDYVWEMMSIQDKERIIRYPGVTHRRGQEAQRAAADEYIAELAEQISISSTNTDIRLVAHRANLWNRIITFLRLTLRQAGIKLHLNNSDINNILISSYNNLRNSSASRSEDRRFGSQLNSETTSPAQQDLPSEGQIVKANPPLPEGIGEVSRSDGGVNTTGAVGGNTTLNQQPSAKTGNTTNTTPTQSLSPSTQETELDIFLRENRAANDRHREQWKSIPRPRDLQKAYEAGDTQAIEQWKAGWEAFLQQLIPMDIPVIDGTISIASRNKAVKMVQTPQGYKVDKDSAPYKAFDYIEKSLKKRKRQLEHNLTEDERRTIDIVKRGLRGELNNTRLRAVSETFDSQLQQQIDGTLPAGHIYNLGMPGAILRSAGLPNLPIELAASRLTDKSMQENHPFDIAEVRGLVDAIQDPLAIFRSATHIGSFVVLTEIQHGGRNFVVAIEANRRQGRIEVNSIRSVYPKNNKQVANWIEEGLLEYAHKERMSEWFSKQQSNSADVRKLFRHTAKIVQNFENPKLPDTRFRFIGERGAANLDRAEEATTRLDNLAIARDMEQAGRDERTIKLATGWERGADNLWRYEMPDNFTFDINANVDFTKRHPKYRRYKELQHKLNSNLMFADDPLTDQEQKEYNDLKDIFFGSELHRSRTLKDYIDAPSLFTEYPQLRDVKIKFDNLTGARGYWSHSDNTIVLDNNLKGEIKRVLAHEIQHAIQDIEGFARGGNEHTADELRDKARVWAWRNGLVATAQDYPHLAGTTAIQQLLIDEYTQDGLQQYIPTEEQRIKGFNLYVRGYDNEGYQSAWEQMSKIRPGDNRGTYRRLAGEVEARNVANRLNYTPEERANTLARITEDVARQDQIFISQALGNPAMGSRGIKVTPDEYAKIAHNIATYPNKVERGHVFTDNYYYLCTNISDDGYFNIIAQLPIEGNEELINKLRGKDGRRNFTALERTEDIASTIKEIKRRGGRIDRNIPPTQRQTRVDGRNDNLHLGQQPHTASNQRPLDRDDDTTTRFRVANHNQAIFVSNARQAVENIRQDRATPEQWLAMLQKNGGIKAGEDRWLGLSDWLQSTSPSTEQSEVNTPPLPVGIGEVVEDRRGSNTSKKDSNTITRQQILDFINSNAIRIEEVHYSQFGEALIDQATRTLESEIRQIGWDAMQEKYPGIEELFEYDGRELLWSENLASIGEYEDFILDNNITGANPEHNAINETREQYTTPGLTDNHEIALTIPGIEPYNEYDDIHFGDAGGGRAIAWIRFGDTTDTNGNPVLVIDEIQSKRHQDGRKKGYAKTEANDTFDAYRDKMMEKYNLPSDQIYKNLTNEEKNEYDRLRTAANEEFRTSSDVPDAPFDKNWHELAFKRMLRYAAENGYNNLAWTTGVQQAERYDIGTSVNHIHVVTTDNERYISVSPNQGRMIELTTHPDSDIIITGEYKGKTLSDVVGKKMSKQILDIKQGQDVRLSGDNLHIGGEGMKAFYDRMLPSFVSIYVKKWGSKVQDITLPELGDASQANGLTMHSVEITPDMRNSVMQGQTMFRYSPSAKSSSASRSDDSRGGSQLDGVVDTLPERIRDKFSFRELDDTNNSSSNSNWSPEEQSIIDQARDNGTYLLAPNGRPTNLTPRQWVQVRTKAFKQWFGDWEKQAQKTFLTTHKPVSTLTGDEFATKQGVKLTDQVEKYFATIGGKATSPVYGVVILDRNGADDSLAHGMGRNKAIAYAAVKDVIENGILINYDTNHKGRGYDSAVIAAPIEISGERYICYVTIKRNKNENRYYLHEVWTQKNLTDVRSNAAQKQPSHLQGTAKVLQNILTASDNASKIVDENGEPLVVYRGTPQRMGYTFEYGHNFYGGNKGFWFTTAKTAAKDYSFNYDTGFYGEIKEVFLNIRNPMDLMPLKHHTTSKRFYEFIKQNFNINLGRGSSKEYPTHELYEKFQDFLYPGIHDGIKLADVGHTYITKNPNQIKSATDNIGTFDNRLNDIRFRTTSPIDTARQVASQDIPRRIEQRTAALAQELGVPITVLHSNDQLRPLGDDYNYLADWLDGNIDGRPHRMAGMFSQTDNRLFVFAHNIIGTADPLAQLESTITHEVVAHYGLRKLLGEERLARFLDDVWQSMTFKQQLRWGRYAMNISPRDNLTPQEFAQLYATPYYLGEIVRRTCAVGYG